ncbi:MAG: hypothetical protein H0W62_12340 [Chitinophagales bacterium]|nr:hypothetical protein [Chitinophagales bacterium]
MNSKDFNPGYYTDVYYSSGLGFEQGAIVLPDLSYGNIYDVIYLTADSATGEPSHLSLSKIDMNLDNGLGGILPGVKNIHLVDDTILTGRLTACKNSNGKDWWIITHEFSTARYYTFLITSDSIIGPYSQKIGQTIKNDVDGQSAFSPNGSKYATISPYDGKLDIFDFDRCTGLFSSPISYHMPLTPSNFWAELSFSPDGRFLYVGSLLQIFQFDLIASNVINSKVLVAEWKTFYSPFSTWFYIMQQALDNKIYLCTWGADSVLHVIDKPDSLDIACNVLQNYIKLPVDNATIPNFPNYDLGLLGNYLADAGANDTINKGQSIQLGIPPVTGVMYLWHSDSTLSDTAVAQPIASPDTTTTYYLTVTDTSTYSSCNVREDTVTVFVDIADAVHMPKPQNQGSFRVSPNPVSTWLNIIYQTNDDGIFELYDAFGKRAAAVSLYHYFKSRMLDVSALPDGVYEWSVTQRNERVAEGKVAVVR